ncbi:tyrosine-type recombinase/integrase [Candidatus Sulfurimonas marisnigri]|uniref:Tyrosine-type recombinase/integrase n=1 Tax=Candidatus Sulfurimonas marisnigri TaxID=2740405 RepID=A0A7S7RR38_9BACT|nr:tyrosine-type recombinase/integrase [Candidatus Sulfurimonas marisnigri]QOY55331.1 tyrosine-type recombinase/integrase [Candidatus Sulfurimonas marisnigri]
MAMVKSKRYTAVYINELQNGDKSYYVGYNDASGKWVRTKIGNKSHGITEVYANNKRIEYINIARLGEDPVSHRKQKQKLLFDIVAESYFKALEEAGKKDLYNPKNRYRLHLQKVIGTKSITAITKNDLLSIKEKMLKTHSKASVRHIITLASTIINHAITSDSIRFNSTNVAVGLASNLKTNHRNRYLNEEEVKQLLLAVADDKEVNLFVRLSLSTGGRLNTVMNIQKKHLQGRNVVLEDFKSNKQHHGYISNQLFKGMEIFSHLGANDFLIGEKAELYSQRKIQRRLKKVLDELFNKGLDVKDTTNRLVVHSLRHTFISLLIISGAPIASVSRLVGHNSIDITMRYSHLNPNTGEDFVNAIFSSEKSSE